MSESHMKLIMSVTLSILFLGGVTFTSAQSSSYFSVAGPCGLQFPDDHGSHPGYETEWWYYTGNLKSEEGKRFGFELTFFRRQISPPGSEGSWPKPASAWRTQQVYLAHVALSDISGKRFIHAERMDRGAMGLAGARQVLGTTTVFLSNWSATIGEDEHVLAAETDDFSFKLELTPRKIPVLHGVSGYSLKGSTPERASCYYSFTRLEARGTLTIDGKAASVGGSVWMDHEFSSAPLEPGLVGWDWFSLQLGNNTELMIYLLREKDGSFSAVSSGTFVDESGKTNHLTRDAFSVEVLDTWKSPHSGAEYPARWRVRVQSLGLDLAVTQNLADQEMQTPETTKVTYWEGSVSASGTVKGQPIAGEGYVELTGYAQRFADR